MVLIFIVGIIWKGCGCGKSDKPIPLVFLEMVDLAFPDLEKKKDNYDVFDKTIYSVTCLCDIDGNNCTHHFFHFVHHVLECVRCGRVRWRCVCGKF
jgi:hypothetical protein